MGCRGVMYRCLAFGAVLLCLAAGAGGDSAIGPFFPLLLLRGFVVQDVIAHSGVKGSNSCIETVALVLACSICLLAKLLGVVVARVLYCQVQHAGAVFASSVFTQSLILCLCQSVQAMLCTLHAILYIVACLVWCGCAWMVQDTPLSGCFKLALHSGLGNLMCSAELQCDIIGPCLWVVVVANAEVCRC